MGELGACATRARASKGSGHVQPHRFAHAHFFPVGRWPVRGVRGLWRHRGLLFGLLQPCVELRRGHCQPLSGPPPFDVGIAPGIQCRADRRREISGVVASTEPTMGRIRGGRSNGARRPCLSAIPCRQRCSMARQTLSRAKEDDPIRLDQGRMGLRQGRRDGRRSA